eukprot:scaffold1605_cov129-Chaetoceros_neogracile.AAC.1
MTPLTRVAKTKDEVVCGDCGEEGSLDDRHCCEQCTKVFVCKKCVITCDDCGSHYCKCVREEGSEIKICEDCDAGDCCVCCSYDVTEIPCGRQVLSINFDSHFHTRKNVT